MRPFIPWLALALLLLSSGSLARVAEATEAGAAIQVSRLWLEALRKLDLKTLRQHSELPFRIRGFVLPNGPRALECGGKPSVGAPVKMGHFDPEGGSELVASDEQGFEKIYQCLSEDNSLVHYIPQTVNGSWPRDRKNAWEGSVGEIRLVRDARLDRRLRRYQREIQNLPATDLAVQARMTDNNGLTNHVLLVLTHSKQGSILTVRAVFIDELFEE